MSEYKRLTKENGKYTTFWNIRLKEYEDIGLSPERIKQILDSRPLYRLEKDQVIVDKDAFNHCNELATAYSQIGSPEEFAELAKAKAEGRLVVLPCKVGDTVYRLWYEPCHHGNDCPDGMSCCGCEDECDLKKAVVSRVYGHIQHIVSDLKYFGKTVFLTKEKAEAALKQIGVQNE